MVKRKHKEACYYCDKKACTVEHLPPKQMFKGFDCDSITVPSCEDHNNSKGGTDQAIVSAFLIPLRNGKEEYHLDDKILKAIQIAEPSFERAKRRVKSVPLLRNSSPGFKNLPDISYINSSRDLKNWIRQLTAGLVYDALQAFDSKTDWPETHVYSPDYIESKGPVPMEPERAISNLKKNKELQTKSEGLPWKRGWSARPRPYPSAIYTFQVCIEDELVVFKHTFYAQFKWYVFFLASQETIAKINSKLLEGHEMS